MGNELQKYTLTVQGQPYELTPSDGKVILPLHGRKIHHDPACGHLTDSGSLPVFTDDTGLLWWRLLDAPDPAAHARSIGLLNSKRQPLTGLCSCVLRPITAERAANLRYCPLEWALEVFDPDRYRDELSAAERQAAEIRLEFPASDWPDLPVDRYALGLDNGTRTYSYVIEYGSDRLGSIVGGSAMKHLVYYQRKAGTWWHDSRYEDVAEAWDAVREGIVTAVSEASAGRVEAIDDLTAVRAGNTVIAKTLHIYANGSILPVYSDTLTRHFVSLLADGQLVPKMRPFERKAYLKRLFHRSARAVADWSPDLAARFLLWWAPPLSAPRVVRMDASPAAWPGWLADGMLSAGDHGVDDLHRFADHDEFTEAHAGVPGRLGLWDLLNLRPGDRVVATQGNSVVLAVGRVADDGYLWRPGRGDHPHTVAVDWDTSYATKLDPPVSWRTGLVSDVRPGVWTRIRNQRAQAAAVPGDETEEDEIAEVDEVRPLDAGLQRIEDALARRGQAVLYGPPGTGKTYEALRYAVRRLGELSTDLDGLQPYAEPGEPAFRATHEALAGAGRLTMVTFHPGYGYEDFIEGLRPVKGETGFALEVQDGVFKRICAAAAKDPDHTYLVVVDELNRGDLPKIFGELITLLEKDKRGLPVTLALSGDPFSVPANVHLLGTMNTADRSIRMLDSAIRRRFAFIELLPDTEPLRNFTVGQLDLAAFLDSLNARIRSGLDREKQIGQAFLLPGGEPVSTAGELASIIRDEILPLLQEYVYDDYGLLAKFLGKAFVDPGAHTLRELTDEKLVSALYEEHRADAAAQPE